MAARRLPSDREAIEEHAAKASPELQHVLDLYWSLTQPKGAQFRIERISWRNDSDLRRAIELDPSEITARMMIESLAIAELDSRALPLRAILDGDPETLRQIDVAKELFASLRSPALQDPVFSFRGAIAEALKRYGALDEAAQAAIDDVGVLAPVRLSALSNMDRLKEFQFLRGAPAPEGEAPIYYEHVFQFWNVNSLLSAAVSMRSGVMLALVRDPREAMSYFAFCVRSGSNLFLLTDIPDNPHPEYRNRTRKPERRMESRIAAGFFPYDLLDLAVDDRDHLYVANSSALVPYQQAALPLRAIADLAPEERVWIALMFDLIVYRYWHLGRQLPHLCYTGEMVRTPDALTQRATERLPVVLEMNPTIDAPILTTADVRANAIPETDFDKYDRPLGANRWMEDLYGQDIDDDLLNPVMDTSRFSPHIAMTIEAGQVSAMAGSLTVEEADKRSRFDIARCGMSVLRPDDFGTKEKILSDRRWIARHNFAKVVEMRARADFKAHEAEVDEWFRKAVEVNAPFLLGRVEALELIENGFRHHSTFKRGLLPARLNMLTFGVSFGVSVAYTHCKVQLGTILHGDHKSGRLPSGCLVNGQKSVCFAKFTPTSSHGLSLLTGVPVEELPVWLRHWESVAPYAGNSILDRVDTMDHIENPWRKKVFTVAIQLSRKTLKAMGLEVIEDESDRGRYPNSRPERRGHVARIDDAEHKSVPLEIPRVPDEDEDDLPSVEFD